MKVIHNKTNIPYTIINFEKEKITKLNIRDKINATIEFMYKTSHPYFFRLLNHYETDTQFSHTFRRYNINKPRKYFNWRMCKTDGL